MPTPKKKKTTKVRDLKPSKDARGGSARQNLSGRSKTNRPNKYLY
jgi:hypothetical protein